MTPKRFTRINGLEPKIITMKPLTIAAIEPATGVEIARCTDSTEKKCLGFLVNLVYKHNSAIAMARDGYACTVCSCVGRPLQTHHVVFRSHGRDDRVGNLATTCFVCHEQIHNSPKGRRAHEPVQEEPLPELESVEAGQEARPWD